MSDKYSMTDRWLFCVVLSFGTALVPGCFAATGRRAVTGSATSAPLGSISDEIWMKQEELGEASDFVIPTHEFKLHSQRLNADGEDHVKEIALRLQSLSEMPVVIERSSNGNQSGQYKYPVNAEPDLDNQRREIVVRALHQLGVNNADELVVVAPAFATPAFGQEAEAAYYQSFQNTGSGGFGGFGGGGSFGGNFGGNFGGSSGGLGGNVFGASSDTMSSPTGTLATSPQTP